MNKRDIIIFLNLIFLRFLYYYAFSVLVKELIPINLIIAICVSLYIAIFVLSKVFKKLYLQFILNIFSIVLLLGWVATLPLGVIISFGIGIQTFFIVIFGLYILPIFLICANMTVLKNNKVKNDIEKTDIETEIVKDKNFLKDENRNKNINICDTKIYKKGN